MINKNIAINIIKAFYPRRTRGWDKPQLNKMVGDADNTLMTNPVYVLLGDVRQSVLVVLKIEKEDNLVDNILAEMVDTFDPVKVSKMITGSNWAKRKANVKAAQAMKCQIEKNVVFNSDGCCGCGCG